MAIFFISIIFPRCWGRLRRNGAEFNFDVDWPKPLPNKWKIGGVTGFTVDKDDNVWAYDGPNDLTELKSRRMNPPIADCASGSVDDSL